VIKVLPHQQGWRTQQQQQQQQQQQCLEWVIAQSAKQPTFAITTA
jgi:hypothetical protein